MPHSCNKEGIPETETGPGNISLGPPVVPCRGGVAWLLVLSVIVDHPGYSPASPLGG